MPIDESFPGQLRRRGKSKIWHYIAYVGGKLKWKSTGLSDKQKAKARARDIYEEWKLLQPDGNEEAPMLGKAIVHEVAKVKAGGTELKANRVLRCLLNFLEWSGDILLGKITTEKLDEYQQHRIKTKKPTTAKKEAKKGKNQEPLAPPKNIAASTVTKEMVYISRLLRHNGFMVQKPKPVQGRKTLGRPFNREELGKFFDVCRKYPQKNPGQYLSLFLLTLSTGTRPSELLPSKRSTHVPLLKKEVDLEKGAVFIRSAKQEPGRRGKSALIKVALPLLKRVMTEAKNVRGEFVFPPAPDLMHIFDKILDRAGLEKIDTLGEKLTSHSFRHTFGVLRAESGDNAFVIQNVMRHMDPSQTSRYLERAESGTVIDISPYLIEEVSEE